MTGLVERFAAGALLASDTDARVMRPQLGDVAVHWHDYYELSLVVSGEAVHIVNGERRELGPGHAFLLSPADFHEIRLSGRDRLDCYNVVVEPGLVEAHLSALGPASVVARLPWHTADFLDAEADLRRLQRELDAPRLGSRRLVDALVAGLVIELARRCGPTVQLAPVLDDRGLHAAVLFVDRHFREPLRLGDVAARAHLSPNYFSERFRQYTGSPFQQYLLERRLRFAHSLLTTTMVSVTEVCHAAGFNSLSYFGRAYRRRYGSAPSAGPRRAATSQDHDDVATL